MQPHTPGSALGARHWLMAALATLGVEEVRGEDRREVVAPRVDVIGSPGNLPDLASTATVIDQQELQTSRVFTTNEALRKVPGVFARDEEGFGLRPNIGIRGLNPSRSTKVLLLEDGIPLSYAPYGDNASYYHPPVDRFARIEVLKGAEQLRFGPQTAGGVINYITPVPTGGKEGMVSLTVGNQSYVDAQVSLGRGPLLLDYIRKQGDGSRDNVHTTINDLNLKAVLDLGSGEAVTLRANVYTEDSQVTYTGLTLAEYENFGAEYNPFGNDKFNSERIGLSATHELPLGANAFVLINVYGAYFNRDWWRQSSSTTDTQCNPLTVYTPVTTSFQADRLAGIEVDPDRCASDQGRLRTYYTYGIEPRLFLEHRTFGIQNQLEMAVRAHYESQDRRQENGTSPDDRSGTVVEDNDRYVHAYSAFLQNRFVLGRWSVTPMMRVEHILYDRTNNLTGASGNDTLTKWLPGLGVTYAVSRDTMVYADVHRGFSPPRTEDLISNTGAVSAEVPDDWAMEYEIGLRTAPRPGVTLQAAVFRNDFDQQVVVGSVAGNNLPLSVGSALYEGLEAGGQLDFAPLFGLKPDVYLRFAYQWLPTARITGQFEPVSPSATPFPNTDGNRLPYAPKNLLTVGLGYKSSGGLSSEIEAVYTGEQYTDFANTRAATANGQAGIIDGYTIVNFAVNYAIRNTGWTTFFTIKNVFDKEYIADRTRGILPGTPRLVQGGVEYRF